MSLSAGIIVCLSVLLFDMLSAYPIKQTDIQTIHPSVACPGGGRVVRWCWVNFPVPGRPTILITVGQGPIALALGAGGGGLDSFILVHPFSSFSLSLGDGSI